MITTTYKTTSDAVSYFLDNTKLRRSPRREALVDKIKHSPRPMALADQFLDTFGRKDQMVPVAQLRTDILHLKAKKGAFDPCFSERIKHATAQAEEGRWTKTEHAELLGILSAAWSPWGLSEQQEAKAHFAAIRDARGQR